LIRGLSRWFLGPECPVFRPDFNTHDKANLSCIMTYI
jgi:hypothetical protein